MRDDHYDLRDKSINQLVDEAVAQGVDQVRAGRLQEHDPVKSPSHYAKGKYEVWNIIDYFKLNYRLGNVIKYILRAGVKTPDPLEDLKKARAYLDREIGIREGRIIID
jgi:hypothetical protein